MNVVDSACYWGMTRDDDCTPAGQTGGAIPIYRRVLRSSAEGRMVFMDTIGYLAPIAAFAWLPLLKFLPEAIGALGVLSKKDSSDSDKAKALAGAASGASGLFDAPKSQDGAIDSLLGGYQQDRMAQTGGGYGVSDDELLNPGRRMY